MAITCRAENYPEGEYSPVKKRCATLTTSGKRKEIKQNARVCVRVEAASVKWNAPLNVGTCLRCLAAFFVFVCVVLFFVGGTCLEHS